METSEKINSSAPTKKRRGGKREGAGRPSLPYAVRAVTFRISLDDRDFLMQRGGTKFLRKLIAEERVREARRKQQ